MKKNDFSFFRNTECQYYPCHDTADGETFNCLFCYCPLYALGSECGGNFTYSESGKKKCTNCLIPHSEDGYKHVMSKIPLLNEKIKAQEEKK